MSQHDRREARPVPVPPAARALIRQVAPERAPAPQAEVRPLVVDGESWVARAAGEGVAGAGAFATPVLIAIRFFRAEEPDVPRREALLPRGRFEALYDEELIDVFRSARSLLPSDEPPRP